MELVWKKVQLKGKEILSSNLWCVQLSLGHPLTLGMPDNNCSCLDNVIWRLLRLALTLAGGSPLAEIKEESFKSNNQSHLSTR